MTTPWFQTLSFQERETSFLPPAVFVRTFLENEYNDFTLETCTHLYPHGLPDGVETQNK